MALSYQNEQDAAAQEKAKTLVFTKDGETNRHWKLRVAKPSSTHYTYKVTYIMQDGSEKPQKALVTGVTPMIVSDLVKYKLQETFLFDSSKANKVLIDIKAGATFQKNIVLDDSTPFKTVTIPQDTADHQTFSFTCGFIPPYEGQPVYEHPNAEYPSMIGIPYKPAGTK